MLLQSQRRISCRSSSWGWQQSSTALSTTLIVAQCWAIFCPSAEKLLFFSKTFPRLVLDSWVVSLRLDPSPADMLSLAVVFVQASFNLLALSTYPVVCFLHCLLNPPIRFPVFFCSFCFIPLLLQVSPLITEVENIFGDPRRFPAMFLPKYPTGCICHCCIVGGNHGIDVHVLISQSKEWCEFPTYCCLKSASQSGSLKP